MLTKRVADVAIVVLSIATLVTMVSAARRRFARAERPEGPAVRSVSNWRDYLGGHKLAIGQPDAQAVIVEFGDFQCPFCARFAHVLDTVATRVPGGFQVYFRHFPIPSHMYAHSAAVASECAAEQGHFDEFYQLAYKSGNTLPVLITDEPRRLPDPHAFSVCMKSLAPQRRITADSLAAVRLGVTGTPGVLVGSTFITGVPSAKTLVEVLSSEKWR